jgi:alkylation response protein AidB-like acyl-CoA dehydrogenase
MRTRTSEEFPVESRQEEFLRLTTEIVPEMRSRAEILDREPCFPEADCSRLRAIGALAAVVPQKQGGLGLGIDPGSALTLFELLRILGSGNLAVGRIFEGHVNALKLILLYGDEAQKKSAIDDVRNGHLFAIWIADDRDPVRLVGGSTPMLVGRKAFCSAAGYASRALITAQTNDGVRMLLVPVLAHRGTTRQNCSIQGMRASVTSGFSFNEVETPVNALIGCPGDYTREPTFSAGAWRTTAVTLGGLDALIDETRKQLIARGRHQDPHQLARMGRAFVAQETARLWVRNAAQRAESKDNTSASLTAYVNLTRTAVEATVLDTIQTVQRCLGLGAFLVSNPVERLVRDLATYVRQPAPDEALCEAAAWRFEHDFPEDQL